MPYAHLFRLAASRPPVRIAVLGAGMFGASIVTHSAYVPALRVCAVADTDLHAARRAYQQANVDDAQIVVCENAGQAAAAVDAGRYVITSDPRILFGLRLDLIAEATGSAEAAAGHAQAALGHGHHVAMVTKEADAAVGPILHHRARAAGLVYTPVDGDQHGLLINLVAWARMIGLEVLCGGKMLDSELVVQQSPPAILHYGRAVALSRQDAPHFERFPDDLREAVSRRAQRLGDIGGGKPWDLAELTIAANATGLAPDVPRTHCPACWTTEIPALLCPGDLGGLLAGPARIDAAQIIRLPHEASLGGGVFVVVSCRGPAMQNIMAPKGMICHPDGHSALLMHPYHLLGIEAIASILTAVLLPCPSALDYRPRFDVVYRTTRGLAAGETLGDDHSPALTAEIIPAVALGPTAPVPAGLAAHARLRRAIAARTVITFADVERPANSMLWALRDEQDQVFLAARP